MSNLSVYRLHITDLHLPLVVGVFAHERLNKQSLHIDVTVTYMRPTVTDDITSTYDYATLVQQIESYAMTAEPYLIETVAEAIANIALQVAFAKAVIVTVKKPGALVNGLASVTIEKNA